MNKELKTSEEWHNKYYSNITVFDPDGWNRSNWHFSWFKEKITRDEFEKRMFKSTCIKK